MCDLDHHHHDDHFGFLVDTPQTARADRRDAAPHRGDSRRGRARRGAAAGVRGAAARRTAGFPSSCATPDETSKMGGGIGQYALYRAEDKSLCLFSLVVPVGAATPVHDHLAWGLVGIYRGRQDETVYRRLDDGTRSGARGSRGRRSARSSGAASATRCCRRPTTSTTSARSPTRRRSPFTCSRTTPRASGVTSSSRPPASSRRSAPATPTRRARRSSADHEDTKTRRTHEEDKIFFFVFPSCLRVFVVKAEIDD